MPRITYVEIGGREHWVEVPVGHSVMRGAVDNNIPGIDADCGGECACATCHVYVDEAWLGAAARTISPSPPEARWAPCLGPGTVRRGRWSGGPPSPRRSFDAAAYAATPSMSPM